MGFESRAISARETKQIVTIFSKTCDNETEYLQIQSKKIFRHYFMSITAQYACTYTFVEYRQHYLASTHVKGYCILI